MKVTRIRKEVEFDMGHRVSTHASKCWNPHGHRYKVIMWVEGPLVEEVDDPAFGMVLDFSDLKAILTTEIHDLCDHAFMFWQGDEELSSMRRIFEVYGFKTVICPYQTTAENLAAWFTEILEPKITTRWPWLTLRSIHVFETPTSEVEVIELD